MKFETLNGDSWKKALIKSRKRRKGSKERIKKQIEEYNKKQITEKGTN